MESGGSWLESTPQRGSAELSREVSYLLRGGGVKPPDPPRQIQPWFCAFSYAVERPTTITTKTVCSVSRD